MALYYRGRYRDAIRYLVTAIEVVLECKLRDALAQKGLSDDEMEQRLERTFNDFEGRLADYVRVTGRRMPGPLISVVPWINGVRLKQELDSARQLRHKVVHESLRLERSMKGYLQRPMETISWLFNWFRIESPISVTGLSKHYTLKMAMLSQLDFFSPEYTKDGVAVKQTPQGVDGVHFIFDGNLLRDQLIEATDRDTTDVEKFALMCFSYLKYRFADSPHPEPHSPFLHERCFISDSANKIVVFLIDTCELMSQALLQQVATRVLALKQQGATFSSVICLVNHQNGLAWQLREVEKAIPDDIAQVAVLCDITLITAVDLLLLVLGSDSYKWDVDRIRAILSKPGRQGACTPNCTRVGTVYHFYEKPQVVSVALDPSAVIHAGDMLVLRLPDRYHRQSVDSIQVKKSDVTEAHGEDHAGIKTTLHRGDVPLGSVVFI